MGFVGKEPAEAALTSADITNGIIVDADINASAAIAMSKTAFSAGTGITLSTNTLNVDAAQTGITSLLATDIKIGEDDQTKIDFEDDNKINFYANNAKEVELAENSLSPGTSDGTALGTTSLMWSDLFLASGSVINFNNGDVTLTHSGNTLTVAGGTLATAALTSSTITASGIIKTDDTTDATSTTDGSLQTDGGLSVAKDAVIGDDLMLLSDSAILSLGAGNDATLTHDGTTGLTIAATPISIDSTGELHLNSTTGDIKLQDGGTDQITFDLDGTAGEVIMKPAVDSDDLVISQYDGTEVIRIEDNASLGLVGNKLSIANSSSDVVIKPLTDAKDIIFQQYDGTEVARVEDNATFNIGTSKLAINGTAVTATAAELNLLDGGTSVGGSITLTDSDGVVVNDGGTMKTIPASDISTYIGGGGGSIDLVADGSISAGDRVAITAAGKAQTVAATQTGASAGTNATNINSTGQSGGFGEFAGYADPDGERFVLFFNDGGNNNYATCIVVDLSNDGNDTFSEGSEVVIDSTNASSIRACYDPNVDRGLVTYENASSYLKSKVVSLSGSTPSFGSEVEIHGVNSAAHDIVFDSSTNRVILGVVGWDSGDSAWRIFGKVLTITGSSTNQVSNVGTQTKLNSIAPATSDNRSLRLVADPDTSRVVFVFSNGADNGCDYLVATATGASTNTIAFGSVAEVGSGIGNTDSNFYQCLAYDTVTNKVIHTCYNGGAGRAEARIGTVTGSSTNTVSWGSPTILNKGGTDGMYDHGIFADPDSGMIYVFGEDYSATNGTDLVQFMECKVDSTSLSILGRRKIYTTYIEGAFIAKGGQGNKVCAFMEEASALYAICPELTKNAYSYIGIANSAISDTATGTIQLTGSQATNQSSLTAGVKYYVDFDGSLSGTNTGFSYVGTASAATTIILDGASPDAT